MTKKTAKTQWAAPKLQRLSAKLAENGAAGVSDQGQNNQS